MLEVDRKTHQQIGSGPFMLGDHVVGTRYHYVRFPKYHSRGLGEGVLPYLDSVDAFYVTDESAREAAFRSDQVHYYTPAQGVLKGMLDSMKGKITHLQGSGLQPFTWNLGNAPNPRKPWIDYKDTRFREAMYRLTDRQRIIDLVFEGRPKPHQRPCRGSAAIYQLDKSETAQYFRYDVAEAKKLLGAMGYSGTEFLSSTRVPPLRVRCPRS
jgi:ABC-type transport system substrate-binding protein